MFFHFESNSSHGRVKRYTHSLMSFLYNTDMRSNAPFRSKKWYGRLKDNEDITDDTLSMYWNEFSIFSFYIKSYVGYLRIPSVGSNVEELQSRHISEPWSDDMMTIVHNHYRTSSICFGERYVWHVPSGISDEFGPFYKQFSPWLRYSKLYREYLEIMASIIL